jgi:hypothetical protein
MPSRKAPVLKRPLMDLRRAAEYTGFSYWQLRRWINEKTLPIPTKPVFGRPYIHPDDLDRLVDSFPSEIHGDPATLGRPSRKRGPQKTCGKK